MGFFSTFYIKQANKNNDNFVPLHRWRPPSPWSCFVLRGLKVMFSWAQFCGAYTDAITENCLVTKALTVITLGKNLLREKQERHGVDKAVTNSGNTAEYYSWNLKCYLGMKRVLQQPLGSVHTSDARASADVDARAIKTSVNVTWRRRKEKENVFSYAHLVLAFSLAPQIPKCEWRWHRRRRKAQTIFACVACITCVASVNALALALRLRLRL